MKVIFMGSGEIGLPVLLWLAAAPGIELVGVVTQPDRPSGRGLQVKPGPIKQLATQHSIPTLQPAKVRTPEALEQIAALHSDIFVVMAYGQILPQQLLDIPPLGAINLHASLLPRHRGAAPVHAAVLAGDSKSGVTVMWMDVGLDTGDILLAKECAIEAGETAGSLHEKIAELAPMALSEALDLIRAGRAPRRKQDDASATYAPKLDRSLGRLDWSKGAGEIDRTVRGLYPWPGCTAAVELQGGRSIELKIHRAKVCDESAEPSALRFPCTAGGVIELLEVQPAGGRRMSGAEFVRGNKVIRAI